MLKRAFHLRLGSVITLVLGLAFSLAPPAGAAFAATPTPATPASRCLEVPSLLVHLISAGQGKSMERYVVSRLAISPQLAWGQLYSQFKDPFLSEPDRDQARDERPRFHGSAALGRSARR